MPTTNVVDVSEWHPTDPNGNYPIKPGAFVGIDYSTTELAGGKMLVASPDGINKIPKLGPDGSFLFNQNDAQSMREMLIEGKSALATKADAVLASQIASEAKQDASDAMSQAQSAIDSASIISAAASAASQAVTEAKQGASYAMSQAQSAWSQAMTATDTASSAQSSATQATSSVAVLSTSVDTLKGNVTDLQASITTQADEIKSKVTSSDVTGMLTGYATQTYTQSLVTQTANQWNVNLTKLSNDTQTSMTNLSETVDGIKTDVYNSDGSSKIVQLSSLIATKVSSDDYNSQITQLNNDINLRVQKSDLISQINLQAGTTLIQSNKIVLDADTTVFTGDAFIPSAAISNISADKIMLGSSALYNSDGTLNLVNQSNGLKALIQVKQGQVQDTTQSIISFSSDYNNRAFSITPVGATVTPTLFFERYDQTAGHWLGFSRNEVQREGLTFNTWDNDGERFFVSCHARFNKNITAEGIIMQGTWNGTTGKPEAGILSIEAGNTIWSGSGFLAVGDHISNSYTNVIAKSFSQQSTLSSKTNIETVDPKDALNLINQTDIRSYQYKSDVAQGKTKRYTSLIIDDVNDVSQYYAPDEFTNEERTGRDDGSAVGYLFLAVKELTRRIKTLEDKLNG